MATVSSSLVQISDNGDGTYDVKQVEPVSSLPKIVNDGDRKEINIPFGPGDIVRVTGYVVPSTLEAGLEATVFGQKIGPIYGSLTKGLGFNIDIGVAKGGIHINHEGNDVKLKVNIGGFWWPFPDINVNQQLFTL